MTTDDWIVVFLFGVPYVMAGLICLVCDGTWNPIKIKVDSWGYNKITGWDNHLYDSPLVAMLCLPFLQWFAIPYILYRWYKYCGKLRSWVVPSLRLLVYILPLLLLIGVYYI